MDASLQLDQLHSAPWSPIGAAMHSHNSATTAAVLVEIDMASALIWQDNVGKSLADFRPDSGEVDISQF